MNENKIQHEIIMWFSQKYPQYRGLLFEVNNNPANAKHAIKRKAMGMVAGVSDLVFIIPKSGKICGIEIKAPNSVHKAEHIQRQFDWGSFITLNFGFFLMSSNIIEIKELISNLINENFIDAGLICKRSYININNRLTKKTIRF